MKIAFSASLLWIGALCLVAGGCVSLEKSYPDKRYFVLEIDRREVLENRKSGGVLMVSNLRVSPRYEGRSFVYRLSEARYEADFYNQFLVAPAALLSEEVRKAMSQAQIAEHVIGAASPLEPTHRLEGSVGALYGDFRDRSAPKAVLEMEFFLSKDSPAKIEILARKHYRKSIDLDGRSAEALVKGWNVALNEILTSLAADLRSFNF